MEVKYYRSRLAESLLAAKKAADPCSRIVHEKLARGYRAAIDNAKKLRDRLASAAHLRRRNTELDSALDEWENEGGS